MTQHHKRSLHAEPTCPKEVFLRLGGDTFIVSGVLLFNGALHYHTNPSSPMLSPLTRCSRLCPMGHTGKPRQTRYWLNERSTHYWEGLQSQGKWSWLCCCKFLAISPILSLDLLLATGFSCHESEYHILKKKKKKESTFYIILGKSEFLPFLISKRSNRLTNSLALSIQISLGHTKRKHQTKS